MQTLLARYEERQVPGYGRRLYDGLSRTPFLDFTDHLLIVQQRLPARARCFSKVIRADPEASA